MITHTEESCENWLHLRGEKEQPLSGPPSRRADTPNTVQGDVLAARLP